MAYRRRQQISRPSPITTSTSSTSYSLGDEEEEEDSTSYEDVDIDNRTANSSPASLVAKAIRASSGARRDSSLSSAYNYPSPCPSPSPSPSPSSSNVSSSTKEEPNKANHHEYTSMKTLNESKQQRQQGFWGSLARKAKSILDDDSNTNNNNAPPPQKEQQPVSPAGRSTTTTTRQQHYVPDTATKPKFQNSHPIHETNRKSDSPALQKGLNAISSSLNYIGNAVEGGLTRVENRTADIIQETRRHMQRKPNGTDAQDQATHRSSMWQQPEMQTNGQQPLTETDQELQLKASRDVAMAMAAKAKLLLRELKTVKADLAFAKERCAQLEEENKILRENHERGENPEDDDLIRLQLETLLAEKARLAHENSIYARENRFLREVVEYHQLTMQDVVYLDEGTEEVTEVYPIKVVSSTPSIPSTSPRSLPTESLGTGMPVIRDTLPHPIPPPGSLEVSQSAASPRSYEPSSIDVDIRKHLNPSVGVALP